MRHRIFLWGILLLLSTIELRGESLSCSCLAPTAGQAIPDATTPVCPPGTQPLMTAWLRCTLPGGPALRLVTFGYPYQTTLYLPGEARPFAEGGMLVPPRRRPSNQMDPYWFELPAETTTFLARLTTEVPLLPPRAITPRYTLDGPPRPNFAEQRNNHLIIGITSGFLLGFILYSFSLYLFTRQSYYIYYSLFLLFSLLYTWLEMEKDPTINFLFSHWPYAFTLLASVFSIWSILFYVRFFISFLDIRQHFPRWYRALWGLILGLAAFSVLDIVLTVVFNLPQVAMVTSLMARVSALVMGVISVVLIQRLRKRIYNLVVAGTAFYLLGSAVMFLLSTFFVEVHQSLSFNLQWVIQIATLTELLFFGLALSYRRQQTIVNRTEAEAKLRQHQELDRAKSRLYTNVTHEFRTPLTVILGMTDELRRRPGHTVEKRLQAIESNGEKLLRLINELLDLNKLEAERLEVNWQRGDVVTYLRYLTESYQSYAWTRNRKLSFYSELPELDMDYDALKLQRILDNLLSNAIKFTPAYGTIQVIVARAADELRLEVQDDGPGIPDSQRDRIFDRFYQILPDDKPVEGTGIGLAMVKEYTELLGGRIEVADKSGRGSVFTIWLPVHREAAPQTSEPSPLRERSIIAESRMADGVSDDLPTLLIIEDHPDVIAYIKACLTGVFRFLVATDGRTGIERAIAELPDIILSDVMMPEADGFEVCGTLKKRPETDHIPIILLTAKATYEDRLQGLGKGADAYLQKPFRREELLLRLQKLIELRTTLQHKYRQSETESVEVVERPEFLQRLDAILEETIQEEDQSVVLLARRLHLSRSQLHRKVKALTGESMGAYRRQFRLRRAAQLLRATGQTAAEVAYSVGYKTPSHFTNDFKKQYGVPPGKYRTHDLD